MKINHSPGCSGCQIVALLENAERVVALLRELRDATDMPMHHTADIDQFMGEVLGVWK